MSDPTTPHVRCDRDGALAIVTLDRPEARNAIGQQMIDELHAILDGLVADRELACAIVTGAGGKAFASGADIKLLLERRAHHGFAAINQSLFRRIEELPVPTIAAIEGFALGGGCELALACDLRVAGDTAKLGQPEVSLGILPGAGGTQRLARLVGPARAKQLIFTAQLIDAAEASRIGLVNEVVPAGTALARAKAIAGQIQANSALAVRLAKIAMNASLGIGPGPGYALESVGQSILFEDPEKTRRMTEFVARSARKAGEGKA